MSMELSAEEITRRVRRIDPQVTILHSGAVGWVWSRPCPKHAHHPGCIDHTGQHLADTYSGMKARLLSMYGAQGLDLNEAAPERGRSTAEINVRRWHEHLDSLCDLIALSVHRNYVRGPELTDMLALTRQLRQLIQRYERDELNLQ